MEVHLRFYAPFDGFIYVENYHQTQRCRWYGNMTEYLNLTIPVNINSQENSTSPCGAHVDKNNGIVSAILVVSPLRGVLVSGIAHLQVSCIYTIKDFTVTFPRKNYTLLRSLKAETGMITGMAAKPMLFMQILENHGINGIALSEATIGQQITLDVVLENSAIYDFTIYSCIAHDGSKSSDASVQIIDANGCAVPLVRAIEDQVYNATVNGAKHFYIYMYGFQFTSSEFVHFECQARTCVHACQKQVLLLLFFFFYSFSFNIIAAYLSGLPQKNASVIQPSTVVPIVAGLILITTVIAFAFYLKQRKQNINVNEYRSESSYTSSVMHGAPRRSFIYL
ncbi:unnamed protein product [Enterobius vermicularis]|uniref:ZP domain-containing protein n=1 Tax=Enterobius vermicularis TaxID=51028 RepID=A0A0N4VD87_ENTVE|nr:unnamed protein product [Enterobius vermicularis]